ncbi:hypothetical protein LJK87_32475 [Paenibacillus sp. P25]|nr:hypothetical protein LJK87_32475 [Paenibacillus sp. P25]
MENCVIHGMEPAPGPVEIRITAEPGGDGAFHIVIADTGVGMEAERLAEVRRALEAEQMPPGASHIGIVNVHHRIRYLFGSRFGLRLDSVIGQGTTVVITLPMDGEGIYSA